MDRLLPLKEPFKDQASPEDDVLDASKDLLQENQLEDDQLEDDDNIESEESQSDTGGLSEWKRIEKEAMDGPQDNGGGLSEWKTKRKRNGLKGRTPKHPLNKRPYTC